MFGLDYIISPMDPKDFVDNYWGKKACYIPGDDTKFENLYGWSDVNHLISTSRRHAGLRLVHDKKGLPATEFKNLESWLEKGATLVINNANQIDPIIGKFSAVLEHDMNTHVNINTYMSYPAKQGFDTHMDRHDVFAIQAEGDKKWVVYEPLEGRMYPLHKQKSPSGDPPAEGVEPYLECTLTPGDVLYIPRGHWHYALADTASIHLTVGPEARSGAEFLMWYADRIMYQNEFMRKDFPIIRPDSLGGDYGDEELDKHVADFKKTMDELFTPELIKETFIQYCMTTNRLRKDTQLPFSWAIEADSNEQTEFIIPPEHKTMVRYDDETNDAQLIMRGQMLSLEGIPKKVLADLLNMKGEVITGEKLLAENPETSWEDLKKWMIRLYKHGFLILAD